MSGADRPRAERPRAERPRAERPRAERPGRDRPGRDRPRVLVVGAGISGLAAAWELARSGRAEVTVLEASDRVGGALAPVRLTVPADGHGPAADVVVDGGAESLLARRPEALGLAGDVGLGADLVAPATTRALVASRGALHRLPSGTLMGVPSSTDGLAGLLTDDEVARAGAETLTAPVPDPPGDVDVASWVGGRLGAAVVDRIVDPLLGGVYAGSAAGLSMRAALPALWPAVAGGGPVTDAVAGATAAAGAAARAGVAGGAVGASGAVGESVFAGIRGGVWRLAPAVADAVAATGGSVRLAARVTGLERLGAGGHRWRVHLVAVPGGDGPGGDAPGGDGPGGDALAGDGPGGDALGGDTTGVGVLEADAVVLAVPPHVAAPLLAAHLPAAGDALRAVPAASLALVSAVLPPGTLAAGDGLDGLSGILVPPVESRVVKAMTFSSQKWAWVARAAGGRDVVRASVGRYGEDAVLARDDEDLAHLALDDASRLLGAELAPLTTAVTRWRSALAQYTPGHVQRVAALRGAVASTPGLALAGAFLDGVGIPASIASGRRAAAEVLAGRST